MLTLQFIRAEKERLIEGLKKRNSSEEIIESIDVIIEKDDLRKRTQTELDAMLSQQNQLAKEIGQLFKNGDVEEANKRKSQVSELKETSSSKEKLLKS